MSSNSMKLAFCATPPVIEPITKAYAFVPLALSMTKRLLTNSFTTTMDEALEAEGLAQSVNTATEDTAEAIRAFLERREPRFKGR